MRNHGRQRWTEVTSRSGQPGHPLRVLVMTEDLEPGPDGDAYGCLLSGYDRQGERRTQIWHVSFPDAEAWAQLEYGADSLGRWLRIPENVVDAAAYALQEAG